MWVRRTNCILNAAYFNEKVPQRIPVWRFLGGCLVVVFGALFMFMAFCLGFLVAKRPPIFREEFRSDSEVDYWMRYYTRWPTLGGHRIWPITLIGILLFFYYSGIDVVVLGISSIPIWIGVRWILAGIGIALLIWKRDIEDWVETQPLYWKVTRSLATRWEKLSTIIVVDEDDE